MYDERRAASHDEEYVELCAKMRTANEFVSLLHHWH